MDPEFWHSRWQEGETGFHQGKVNPDLEAHWPDWVGDSTAPVLVPLCGKAHDLVWLRDRGHAVVGVELSGVAVRDFHAEHGLRPEIQDAGPFESWSSTRLTMLRGDFFDLDLARAGKPRAWYDRAALIALPERMRRGYIARLRELLPAGSRGLLISLEYPTGEKEGPPFSLSEAELVDLFQGAFRCRRVAERDMLESEPRFADSGLSSLVERVYLLERTRAS